MSRGGPRISRRRLLGSGGAALALPALGLFGAREARAAPTAVPKRLLVVHHPQGTVLSQTVPIGTADAFTVPYILEPLQPYLHRGLVLTGLDNVIAPTNTVGNAHEQANFTFWTGAPFASQTSGVIAAGGPSVEQVVADRIGTDTPFPRIDLAIGGSGQSGIYQPHEGGWFWYGANDPVGYYNDPAVALARLFGDSTTSAADAWALRARRSAVLDGVMDAFGPLRGRVGAADRVRLDAHLEKVSALERRIASGLGACTPPSIGVPAGTDVSYDDDVTAPLLQDLLVGAFACDLTRVATLHFANGHSHDFPWLWAKNGGPIVDTLAWENWHAMVHADYQPGMEHVYRWYMEQLAALLAKLDAEVDADGDNLLDGTLVVCASEFASGRHWTRGIPAFLFGHLGHMAPGRWVDHMAGTVDDYEDAGGYLYGEVSHNQLLVSILQAFGFDDQRFGDPDGVAPEGGVPGV